MRSLRGARTVVQERMDEYYWLRDDARSDSGVLAYLRAENAYTAAVMADTEALQVCGAATCAGAPVAVGVGAVAQRAGAPVLYVHLHVHL